MKIIKIISILALGFIVNAFGQNTIDLTFTAVDNAAYVQLDSIKIMNRTQWSETMVYWPDTSLSLEVNQGDLLLYVGYATFSMVGVHDVSNEVSSFEVYQNYPNPFQDQSFISMYLPQKGKVHMMITDLQGKIVLRTDRQLDSGHHSFRFFPDGGNLYFLTVQLNGISRSITMITTAQNDGTRCNLDYVGSSTGEPVLKTSLQVNDYIVCQSGILDAPEESQTYTFQFATNIPCPGMPTVEYRGQLYNTIQILSQCWLKENLNVGTMIPGSQNMSDNDTIEKYCYINESDSCTKYGGLYQWEEMMQYTSQQGTQGICPPGWHVPSDDEWKVLEGAVDSQYGIGDFVWDVGGLRGYNAGMILKNTSGWNSEGNGTDLFGFSGLPGGYRRHTLPNYWFGEAGNLGFWWTSTEFDYNDFILTHMLRADSPQGVRGDYPRHYGYSVRCVKDD